MVQDCHSSVFLACRGIESFARVVQRTPNNAGCETLYRLYPKHQTSREPVLRGKTHPLMLTYEPQWSVRCSSSSSSSSSRGGSGVGGLFVSSTKIRTLMERLNHIRAADSTSKTIIFSPFTLRRPPPFVSSFPLPPSRCSSNLVVVILGWVLWRADRCWI